jgi:hypothetical protein
MAKALLGYMHSDLRDARLVTENARLRNRVSELESLLTALSAENDRLVAAQAAELIAPLHPRKEMQPA